MTQYTFQQVVLVSSLQDDERTAAHRLGMDDQTVLYAMRPTDQALPVTTTPLIESAHAVIESLVTHGGEHEWVGKSVERLIATVKHAEAELLTNVNAKTVSAAFNNALKQTYEMVDPYKPPAPGSYARGQHEGIIAALRTLQENFTREMRRQTERLSCWCETCRPISLTDMRMVVCPDCGDKRCPHAKDHRNACAKHDTK